MSLQKQIRTDMIAAMKDGDTDKRDLLRAVESMIKNESIDQKVGDDGLSDEGVQALLKRAIKQRKDSAAQYRDGGRAELAEQEEKEIAVIEAYLPEQMTEEEIAKVVAEVVAETGASSPEDMGKVMGPVMAKVGAEADGETVRAVVTKALAG